MSTNQETNIKEQVPASIKEVTKEPVRTIPELIALIGCINEYYSLKEGMSHKFMSDINNFNDDKELESENLMVPKKIDKEIEKAFIAQLKSFY